MQYPVYDYEQAEDGHLYFSNNLDEEPFVQESNLPNEDFENLGDLEELQNLENEQIYEEEQKEEALAS